MNKEIQLDEAEYESLIDDIGATITEGVHLSRWKLIETYHTVGARIRQNCPKTKNNGVVKLLQRVAVELKLSKRTLYNAVKLFDEYSDLSKLPEGKNISWHKICNTLLPTPKVEKEEIPQKDLIRIGNLYNDGKLLESTDEKGAGGYWDLAGDIAEHLTEGIDHEAGMDNQALTEQLQTGIYQVFQKLLVRGELFD